MAIIEQKKQRAAASHMCHHHHPVLAPDWLIPPTRLEKHMNVVINLPESGAFFRARLTNSMSGSTRSHDKADGDASPRKPFAQFPKVVNERIDTKAFLMASRGVVRMIDKFGKLFAPVKYDMQGNIEKLKARYLTDSEINETLQDMILLEIAIGESLIATDALLWLTRGLHMIQCFFEKIVADCRAGRGTEDLVAVLKKSYEETLEPYHGWMAKQLFGLLSRMVPSRTHILQVLAGDEPGNEAATLDAMEEFTKGLKINVMALHAFYEEHNLDHRRNIIRPR